MSRLLVRIMKHQDKLFLYLSFTLLLIAAFSLGLFIMYVITG
jgi:hypothetical protein